MTNELSDIDPSDMVDIDAQLYKEALEKALALDPVGYVTYLDDGTVLFGIAGHTHNVSRRDAVQLARSIYDVLEEGP